MKVLVESYSVVMQNASGGVQTKIREYIKNLSPYAEVKLFDKWNDKITDYDILHVFMASADCYSLVRLAKEKGLKIVTSAIISSNGLGRIFYGRVTGRLFRQYNTYRMQEYIFDASDAIICETIYEKEFLVNSYGVNKNKVFVIPNGINFPPENINDEIFRKKTNITEEFVLQVGRFDPNKNQLNVIEALKDSTIPLVFIGGADKAYAEYYKKCMEKAGDNVHFIGWVDHDDPMLYSAYSAAKVTVLPSHHEIFGNALWEGGICGCNLVATDVLPLKSFGLDKYCLSIKADDIKDIRKKIEIAYNMKKNKELSKIIKEKFSWSKVIEKHIEIYKNI